MTKNESHLPPETMSWLDEHACVPSSASVVTLPGGNANAGFLLRWDGGRAFLRTPPDNPIDPTAHNFAREYRLLRALQYTDVPAPEPLALCTDLSVPRAPFMLMEHIDGVSLTDRMPDSYSREPDPIKNLGFELISALAKLHTADWQRLGLHDFGRPEGFLERQVSRWRAQYERNRVRDLKVFDRVEALLRENQPERGETGIIHGDFHLDNALYSPDRPRLLALIDFEMATVGDPLLDLGLILAFWGERKIEPCAMPKVQALSRRPSAPTRWDLAEEYSRLTGAPLDSLRFYMALAFFKLAAVVEGAFALHVKGQVSSEYARQLEDDVPRLLVEAEGFLAA